MNRLFFWPDQRRYVLFTHAALSHMYRCAQRWPWQREAGGEIFAVDPDAHGIHIATASGPASSDHRSRQGFNPDIVAAHRERLRQFEQCLHAVGLWHTHPESVPTPSPLDRRTVESYLDAFTGEREHYLMVILGNSGRPTNMQVWSVEKSKQTEWMRLSELSR